MGKLISWFEIPSTDFERACAFYNKIFNIKLEINREFNGVPMAMWPLKNGQNAGAIIKQKDMIPGASGTKIYLNANPDLNNVLLKVEDAGGKIIIEKTPIGNEHGYFALFFDTEGNVLGLYSDK